MGMGQKSSGNYAVGKDVQMKPIGGVCWWCHGAWC